MADSYPLICHRWHRLRLTLHGLHSTVVAAIGEVNHQPNNQPYDQARPVYPPKSDHHVTVEEDAKDRNYRHPRSAEWPSLSWIRTPQNHHSEAHDDEGQKRPDVNHSADVVNWRNATHDGSEKAYENGVLPRSAPLGMNTRKKFLRQQTIVGH